MNQTNEMTFQSRWWSVQLPYDWQAVDDDSCVTLSGRNFPSALQISAAKKDDNVVTDQDLKDFASDRLVAATNLSPFKTSEFTGFRVERIDKGIYWREWWLRTENLLIYISYNVDEQFKESETVLVENIVMSVRPRR